MLNFFKYYRYRKRYPDLIDFVDLGLGIEARYQRCHRYWQKHLQLSREFQREILDLCGTLDSLAIFGAGRLIDIDYNMVKTRFNRIELFDADPTALLFWEKKFRRKTNKHLRYHLCDLTGSLSTWTSKLCSFLEKHKTPSITKLMDWIYSLELQEPALSGSYSCLFSVNLLSQLPIYWRDRFQHYLSKFWRMDSDEQGRYGSDLQQALQYSLGLLQQGHLDLLLRLKPEVIVLTTDHWFHYYRKTVAPWQSERALFVDPPAFIGYQLQKKQSWLWHIAPQDIEQPDYGIIHEVHAYGFNRYV